MSRRKLGAALVVGGLACVALGIYLKRAHGLVSAMIALHTAATVGGLLPGLLLLTYTPARKDGAAPPRTDR